MNNHFAVAFIAASALLVAAPHAASARTPSQTARSHGPRRPHLIHTASRSVHKPATTAPAASDASDWVTETGTASYYGPAYHGRRSASGLRFDQMEMTAAHQWLPFGTKVRVALAGSDRSVVVTITDRIYSTHRIVDLSVGAARQLGILNRGLAKVRLTPL